MPSVFFAQHVTQLCLKHCFLVIHSKFDSNNLFVYALFKEIYALRQSAELHVEKRNEKYDLSTKKNKFRTYPRWRDTSKREEPTWLNMLQVLEKTLAKQVIHRNMEFLLLRLI